jgi:hypothetical protein
MSEAKEETDECEGCHKQFPKSKLHYGHDPYSKEVRDEIVQSIYCDECYHDRLNDI